MGGATGQERKKENQGTPRWRDVSASVVAEGDPGPLEPQPAVGGGGPLNDDDDSQYLCPGSCAKRGGGRTSRSVFRYIQASYCTVSYDVHTRARASACLYVRAGMHVSERPQTCVYSVPIAHMQLCLPPLVSAAAWCLVLVFSLAALTSQPAAVATSFLPFFSFLSPLSALGRAGGGSWNWTRVGQ